MIKILSIFTMLMASILLTDSPQRSISVPPAMNADFRQVTACVAGGRIFQYDEVGVCYEEGDPGPRWVIYDRDVVTSAELATRNEWDGCALLSRIVESEERCAPITLNLSDSIFDLFSQAFSENMEIHEDICCGWIVSGVMQNEGAGEDESYLIFINFSVDGYQSQNSYFFPSGMKSNNLEDYHVNINYIETKIGIDLFSIYHNDFEDFFESQ